MAENIKLSKLGKYGLLEAYLGCRCTQAENPVAPSTLSLAAENGGSTEIGKRRRVATERCPCFRGVELRMPGAPQTGTHEEACIVPRVGADSGGPSTPGPPVAARPFGKYIAWLQPDIRVRRRSHPVVGEGRNSRFAEALSMCM